MKKLIYLIFVFVMVASISKSESMNFSASVNVKDFFDNSPIGDINSSMTIYVETNAGTFTEAAFGKTNSSGSLYLSKTINYTGTVNNYKVLVKINPSLCGYAPTEPIGGYIEYVNYSGRMYPTFKVMLDKDSNEIYDPWELSLAQKFCPNLKLHSGDSGVRPVPVEIMDRNGDDTLDSKDLMMKTYTIDGTYIGDFNAEDVTILSAEIYPFSSWKLHFYRPMERHNARINNAGIAAGIKFLIPHFEWGNSQDTDKNSWYAFWHQKINSLSSDSKYINGTTYAHLFKKNGEVIIQYWFFYPFNAAANRHEGDWEHINVKVTNQNPNLAQINQVVYYYHHKQTTRNNPELINNTHPRVYVGGRISSFGFLGHGTHGSYPQPGNWSNVVETPIQSLDEFVDGQGLEIDFDNYTNIVIMPHTKSAVDPDGNLKWMLFKSFWGHPMSLPSAGTTQYSWFRDLYFNDLFKHYITFGFFEEPDNLGNVAPFGPAIKTDWKE